MLDCLFFIWNCLDPTFDDYIHSLKLGFIRYHCLKPMSSLAQVLASLSLYIFMPSVFFLLLCYIEGPHVSMTLSASYFHAFSAALICEVISGAMSNAFVADV